MVQSEPNSVGGISTFFFGIGPYLIAYLLISVLFFQREHEGNQSCNLIGS